MADSSRSHFDFDAWAELARRDPAAFERRRAQVIADFLERVPAARRHRLRCLQWRIDRTRERAANPVAACVRISEMMWDSVVGSGGLLEALQGAHGPCSRHGRRPAGRVIGLRPRPRT